MNFPDPVAPLAIALTLAFPATPALAHPHIAWEKAEVHFLAGAARKTGVYTRKEASRCVGRWRLHADAVDDGAFPRAAMNAFPADLRLGNAIASAEFFRLDVMAHGLVRDASNEAEMRLRAALDGDTEALRAYFEALGECSVTAESVSDGGEDGDVEGPAGSPQ
ncbi:hypothetical protein INR77_13515 [Erythrobacter sp. SCSIO 43205]|uniref:hypothetical protein n=1 Tax=Erythrobacter sp. SCSIO 43205 TaxID=2779361 RepID=UPI001CA8B8BD|nr:hypothetical protein [Erythrobacter sp. SCSIO 43205]UAB77781.1 hypothetical protein INR77_13515 [Erythrobacter sp. SCSIO 43205]